MAAAAVAAGDVSAAGMSGYRAALEDSFVLRDHKRLKRAPKLVLSERMQNQYTKVICEVAEQMFTVTNPAPKPGLLRILWRAARGQRVRWRDLARDGLDTARTFR